MYSAASMQSDMQAHLSTKTSRKGPQRAPDLDPHRPRPSGQIVENLAPALSKFKSPHLLPTFEAPPSGPLHDGMGSCQRRCGTCLVSRSSKRAKSQKGRPATICIRGIHVDLQDQGNKAIWRQRAGVRLRSGGTGKWWSRDYWA